MQIRTHTEPTPPIGVIDSFGKGFETVISQLALVSIPLLLDLFLWLGPRLSIAELFKSFGAFVSNGEDVPVESARVIELSFNSLAESLNLFSFLSTSPLGVPSMMVSKVGNSPLGDGLVIPITSWFTVTVVAFVISLGGLFIGTIYFALIARGTLPEELKLDETELLESIWVGWVRLVGFALAVVVAMLTFGVAVSMLAGLASFVHPNITGLVVSLGVAIWIWGLFYVAFTVHGIVMDNQNIRESIGNSLMLVRLNMPSVVGLFGLIMMLLWGLGYLWLSPQSDSWVLLAGILAHAFVATGLYASTFHFYRDRLRWCSELQEYKNEHSGLTSNATRPVIKGNQGNGKEFKEEDNQEEK